MPIHFSEAESESGRAMALRQWVRVTERGVEALNRAPLDLVVNGTRAPSRG